MGSTPTRKPTWIILNALFITVLIAILGGCQRDEDVSCSGDSPDITRPSFWAQESHCRGVEPDYGKVFDDQKVHQFNIRMSAEDYQATVDNLNTIIFESERPADLDGIESPITVPVEIEYDGNLWTNVGMRWKGHSSLLAAWYASTKKLSFRLIFDHFEDALPDLENQRFYGFKKVVFANGYTDQSFIREKLAGEIFRSAGIPVVESAFSQVYLDTGDGPVYMGLYTFMEDPDDKLLETQFGYNEEGDGNLYKPWGDAARWRDPDENVDDTNPNWWEDDIEAHFAKCTNEDDSDWSDVMNVIKKLHKDRTQPAQWRAELESVFNVQSFIQTLAVSQTMMNWDSYGCMHHNYYIYANPQDNYRIFWFPWDLGESMYRRQSETCADLDDVFFNSIVYADNTATINVDWPLIQTILADSVYRTDYANALQSALNGPFAIDKVNNLIDTYHNLIAPYIVGPVAVESWPYTTCDPQDCSGFEESLTQSETALKPHVVERHQVVNDALGN